jgi:hypothetical protein
MTVVSYAMILVSCRIALVRTRRQGSFGVHITPRRLMMNLVRFGALRVFRDMASARGFINAGIATTRRLTRMALAQGVIRQEGLRSVELDASSRHALRTPQSAGEELHNGQHLIPVAGHAITVLLPVLDLHKLKGVLQL